MVSRKVKAQAEEVTKIAARLGNYAVTFLGAGGSLDGISRSRATGCPMTVGFALQVPGWLLGSYAEEFEAEVLKLRVFSKNGGYLV